MMKAIITALILLPSAVAPLWLSTSLDSRSNQQAFFQQPSNRGPASLPVPNPTRSFWIDTPNANPLAKRGSEGPLTRDSDVCIIGSGITGVSTAYHLSKELNDGDNITGHTSVVMLEARDFC